MLRFLLKRYNSIFRFPNTFTGNIALEQKDKFDVAFQARMDSRMPFDLTRVSSHSDSGSESATIPAPVP